MNKRAMQLIAGIGMVILIWPVFLDYDIHNPESGQNSKSRIEMFRSRRHNARTAVKEKTVRLKDSAKAQLDSLKALINDRKVKRNSRKF